MTVPIRIEFPPNYADIRAVFPVLPRGAIFAYDGVIYNPDGGEVTRALQRHEKVHFAQQKANGGAALWWLTYLVDPEFRYRQELPAHREELAVLRSQSYDRNYRNACLHALASRLSSEMYGRVRTFTQVMKDLRR